MLVIRSMKKVLKQMSDSLKSSHLRRKHQFLYGFSLLEMVIVLSIISVVVGVSLVVGAEQVRVEKLQASTNELRMIQEATRRFAKRYGRLPCPARLTLTPEDSDFGREASDCSDSSPPTGLTRVLVSGSDYMRVGAVPVFSLGLPREMMMDAWNRRYFFAVSEANISAIDDTTAGVITVQDGGGTDVTTVASFVVGTHGESGAGATPDAAPTTVPISCNSSALDGENCDFNDAVFINSRINDGETEASFYDDRIVWDTTYTTREQQAYVVPGTSTSSEECTYSVTDVTDETKITPSDGSAGDQFGYSLDVEGTTLIVGSPTDSDYGTRSGSLYVFEFSSGSWSQAQKLNASDTGTNHFFGYYATITNGKIVTGSFRNGNGVVYVFEHNGTNWAQVQRITASDSTSQFGASIAVSENGTRMVVGADWDSTNASRQGAAYVFDYNGTNWVQTTKIYASDYAANDNFGKFVAVSDDGEYVFVSSVNKSSNTGQLYVYEDDGGSWNETQLPPSDLAAGDFYSSGISVSGGTLFVGSQRDDPSGSNSGSAYVFEFDGTNWTESQKIVPADGAAGDAFSYNEVVGDTAFVSALLDDDAAADSGSFYYYEYDGSSWSQAAKVTASDGAAGDSFGWWIRKDSGVVAVGAPEDDDNGNASGSVYVYGEPQVDCDEGDAGGS